MQSGVGATLGVGGGDAASLKFRAKRYVHQAVSDLVPNSDWYLSPVTTRLLKPANSATRVTNSLAYAAVSGDPSDVQKRGRRRVGQESREP